MGSRLKYWSPALAIAALVLAGVVLRADLVRLTGPDTIRNENRLLVKVDVAFDTANQVYLAVWGTQNAGPVNGQFLDINGDPIGGMFSISTGGEQSGWARVVYSPEQQRFLVAYTKVLSPTSHQRIARLMTYNGGNPSFLTGEIILAGFRDAGNAAGVAYSPGAGVFLATWHVWSPFATPRSYVATLAPDGTILTPAGGIELTNPSDGQSDPNVACNSSGRCLIVGYAWNACNNGQNAIWARVVEGSTATPVTNLFCIESWPIQGDAAATWSPGAGHFVVSFVRDFRTIWGKLVDSNGGMPGAPFLLKQSTNPAFDGGGYGLPSLTYNTGTSSMMLTMGSWFGLACAQELGPTGGLIGATDCVPGSQEATHYTVSAADPVNNRFLMLDNQDYNRIRATVYSVNGGPGPQAPSITTQPQSQTIGTGLTATMSVVAAGTQPMSYQWYVGTSGNTGSPIGGASSSSYTTPALSSTTSYWVRVTNSVGSADSATATITVSNEPPPPPPPPPSGIVRSTGPTTVVNEGLLVVKFDAAFDTVNQVYLVVWGTQQSGPVNGIFVNANGAPIGNKFAISSGGQQSGWARVAYSAEHQRFMVAYTKILGVGSHQRTVRMLTYNGGVPSFLTTEIPVATFVDAGNATGLAYSPAADAFMVTWYDWNPNPMPRSYVAAVSATSGAILGSNLITNTSDGQSDPNIACNDTGTCLAVGYSWGAFAGNQNATWARLITGNAVPVGSSSFYVASAPIQGDATVAYSASATQFLVSFARDFRSIWGRLVDTAGGMAGVPFLMKQSVSEAADGGGFGLPSIAYNSSSMNFMLSMASWTGLACAHELSALGAPAGNTDCLPGGSGATKYVVSVADPVNTRYVLFDNQDFNRIRSTVYTATPVNQPPVITAHPQSLTIPANTQATLNVGAAGTAPLAYQWYEGNSPDTSSPVGGATNPSFTTPALTKTKKYWARVSNGLGMANSNTATTAVTLVQNGSFADGTTGWSTFATPAMNYIVTNVVGGVLYFYRVDPPAGTSNQATVFQTTGQSFPADTPIKAQFQTGNTSSVRKRLTVLMVDADFSDLAVCSFWLEANAPLRTYAMRSHTTKAWSNAALYFYAASAGSNGGAYLLDNVTFEEDPSQSTTRTDCVDPTTPAANGGGESGNLVVNGHFDSGTLLPGWVAWGSIVTRAPGGAPGGVMQYYQPSGQPAGTVLQATGASMTNDQIMTATFRLGNNSGVKKRVTVVLHDQDFSDHALCSFWLPANSALNSFAMRTYATKAWTNATLAFYDATKDAQWTEVDDVTLKRTPGETIVGTECLEPGSAPAFAPDTMMSTSTSRDSGDALLSSTVELTSSSAPDADVVSAFAVSSDDLTPGAVYARANRVDLRGLASASLVVDSRLSGETASADIEVSLDGVNWQPVATMFASDDWTSVNVDLSAWAGHVVYVRFRYEPGSAPGGWDVRAVRLLR